MESRSRKRNTPRSQQSVICEAPEPEAAISSVETRARSLSIEPMVLVAEAVLPGSDAARTRQREGSCARQPREEAQAACASPAASEPDVSNTSGELQRLHIHECDMVDDTEEHAGGVRKRPASVVNPISNIVDVPRQYSRDHPHDPTPKPERYGRESGNLEWDADNCVPDVLAITEGSLTGGNIWIPVFSGKRQNFRDFITKFEDLREVLGWDELNSRAYLLRSLRRPALEVRQHIAAWRYEAMVVYLSEKYTPLELRLRAIDNVMDIRRDPGEPITDLSVRISRALQNVLVDRKRKLALAGAALRHALRMEPRLVAHMERSLYSSPKFFQQVEVACEYERRYGPEEATVVTEGGNDLAVMHLRDPPHPVRLSLPKEEPTEDGVTAMEVARVSPLVRVSGGVEKAKTTKNSDKPVVLQYSPVVFVDLMFLLRASTLHLGMYIKGLEDAIHILVDTGAAVSILPEPIFKRLDEEHRHLVPTDLDIRAGNDTQIICKGMARLKIAMQHYCKWFKHDFYICNEDTTPILGMDFMAEHDTLVHLKEDKFTIDGIVCTAYDAAGHLIRQGPVVTP